MYKRQDIVTGEPVEGAKLQILDEEGTVVREWITTKEEHLEYALPAGNYILHEELPPLEDGYVSAEAVSYTHLSTEMVSPKLEYGEMEKLQQVVRCLRSHGGKVNSSCGMHVHVDASNHTPRSLKNALTIMYSKEDILFKALQVNPSRVEQWCKTVSYTHI